VSISRRGPKRSRLGGHDSADALEYASVTVNPSIAAALAAALLFGASTPFAKVLAGAIPPVLLAGLLYVGSGVGLWAARLTRDAGLKPARLSRAEWPWLAGPIVAGGVLAPVLLMYGRHDTHHQHEHAFHWMGGSRTRTSTPTSRSCTAALITRTYITGTDTEAQPSGE
jgi:drug/metabolite transporter (DMT)-like permease